MTDSPKRTLLHALHVELGVKLVDFSGWEMPVQYPFGIIEHRQCRDKAAVFDVSHMGQVILRGKNVGEELEALCPQAYVTLKVGKARYGFFTNRAGGIPELQALKSGERDHGNLLFRRTRMAGG